MGIGVSLVLLAVGAVLAFAVTATVQGIEIATVGWILMVVGIIGLVFSLLFMASFAPFGGTRDTGHGHSGDPHPHA